MRVFPVADCCPDFAGLQNRIRQPLGTRQGWRVRMGEGNTLIRTASTSITYRPKYYLL